MTQSFLQRPGALMDPAPNAPKRLGGTWDTLLMWRARAQGSVGRASYFGAYALRICVGGQRPVASLHDRLNVCWARARGL